MPNSVSGRAGCLLSRCFNLQRMDPLKYITEIFPFSPWLPGSSDLYVKPRSSLALAH